MSQSGGSTIPSTPNHFVDVVNVNEDSVFAWLRPFDQEAGDAFDATVNAIIKNSEKFQHFRQFLHLHGEKVQRAGSVFTEDEEDGNSKELEGNEQWKGAYKFSLESTRNDLTSWRLGSQCLAERTDILLAPGDPLKKTRIAYRHARMYINRDSYRMMIEARHTVTIGRNLATPITNMKSQVLEHGDHVTIGACKFIFEYTDFFTTSTFQTNLQRILNRKGSKSLNQYLTPATVGVPVLIGNYFCSPSAFAQGTFGKVSAGWTREGSTVAIKHIKKPDKAEVLSHMEIMEYIGAHDNILHLIECVHHLEVPVPDAYCVYAPLATGSLRDVVANYRVDMHAQLTLFTDFLRGLSFLHSQKNIMHLDINPNNLAVTSLDDPKGIIIDLDSAIRSSTSFSHKRGTVPYLAPEIIALKHFGSVQPFDKSVDIWALGLSMFDLYQEAFLLWGHIPPGEYNAAILATDDNYVTRDRYTRFQRKVAEIKKFSPDPAASDFMGWIEDMTQYESKNRSSACDLLDEVSRVTTKLRKGTIVLKTLGRKRAWEE